jgi:hypothetical protein
MKRTRLYVFHGFNGGLRFARMSVSTGPNAEISSVPASAAVKAAATQNKQQYDDDQKCGGAHVVLSALENWDRSRCGASTREGMVRCAEYRSPTEAIGSTEKNPRCTE